MCTHNLANDMNARKQFRELLDRNGIVFAPSVHDAITARVVNKLGGFDLMGISGYGISLSNLGLPDAGYITMDEMVRASRHIANTASVPVYADADTGFGNAINVRRTTREFIQNTEVAGFFMEDQVSPKRCGHVAGKRVVSREEGVGKIRAAADVRDEFDEEFVIIARTDARGAANGDLDEAIERGNVYYEAGADVIFVEGPKNIDEVERIGEEVDAPLKYNQTGISPFVEGETLERMGYKIHSVTTTRIANVHIYNHLKQLRDEGIPFEQRFREEIVDHPTGDLHRFSDFDEVRALEERFLPEEDHAKYEQSIGHDGEQYRVDREAN